MPSTGHCSLFFHGPIPIILVLFLFNDIPDANSNLSKIVKLSHILKSSATIKLVSSAKPKIFWGLQGNSMGLIFSECSIAR